jgi:hypothetical protein
VQNFLIFSLEKSIHGYPINYMNSNSKTLKSQRVAGIFGFLTHIAQVCYYKTVKNAQHFCKIFSVFTQKIFSQ